MKRMPLDPDAAGSRAAFEGFLRDCRTAAARRGRAQLVSITLEAGHLDPLAVLESIYEPGELHFYCEHPSGGLAIAAADAVVRFSPEGVGRFDATRRFIESTLEDTIAIGDLTLPFAGPHFLNAFGFFDDRAAKAEFPVATVFVPRWQVGRSEDRFTAVANLLIEENSVVEALAERVWRAKTKFRAFEYAEPLTGSTRTGTGAIATSEVGPADGFVRAVDSALRLMREGTFRKIVLARALDVEAPTPFHPLAILNTLRGRFPDCYAFSVGNGCGQSFIGASPERLVRMQGREILTEALAGSAPRGRTASEDAGLASALLRSEKDVREQGLVVDSLVRRLSSLGLEPKVGARPRLKQMSNVQHLHTPITARAPRGLHVFDVVSVLHPTPAVGGTPRETACPHIRALEPFERGLYAGPIGWTDANGDGEFLVAIRSALVDGVHARLFAGAGIVEGSQPQMEFAETELKFHALLDVLREQQ